MWGMKRSGRVSEGEETLRTGTNTKGALMGWRGRKVSKRAGWRVLQVGFGQCHGISIVVMMQVAVRLKMWFL
jgi:hypothetical protein